MSLQVHRRDQAEAQTASKSAQLRRETEFSSLLKALSQKESRPPRERIADAVQASAQAYQLPPSLVLAVIKQESGFEPTAKSPCGAQGLMQLMPDTARGLEVQNSFDIEQNIDGGCRYLRQMMDHFGDVKLALAAYNAGPGAVEKYNGIPPYAETQNYVVSVLSHCEGYQSGPGLHLGADLDRKILASAVASLAIVSSPMPLPFPERNRNDEPPPPPPPTAVKV